MGTIRVRVVDGYAVYDGKEQRSSGEVQVDDKLADQLLTAGAVEPVAKKPPQAKRPAAKRTADGGRPSTTTTAPTKGTTNRS